VCFASAGLVCTARDPAAEKCNYEDDDCDGQIDEDFRPARGLYSTVAHCGGCNNDCSKIIAHAVTTSCDLSNDSPTCRVTACEPGYFPYANNTMCLQLPDTLKQAIEAKQQAQQEAQRMEFVLQRERQEAERKRVEAQGIKDFQNVVTEGISDKLLEWKGIEATVELARSTNSKVVVVGAGKTGLPLIFAVDK
jgi:hypothetical protein